MDAITHQKIDRFVGLNNVESPYRLFVKYIDNFTPGHYLAQANNVRIDNSYQLESRGGYTRVKSGSNIHSMWSDGVNCFYIDGASLYQLGTAYTAVALRSGLTLNAKMSYAPFNYKTYYTNNHQIGYIEHDTDHSLVDPVREFKLPLPAGKFIECFMACLYVAVGKILYISDPLSDYYDTRNGYKIFSQDITMVRAVDDGLYVSDDRIWFCHGKSNEDFERIEAYPSRAIPYTDLRVNTQYINDNLKGNIAMWTSENGICMGDNSGNVVNLTEQRYTFTAHGIGAAFIRESGNVRHYVNSLY